MEVFKGECCLSRYAGGSFVYNTSSMDRIMLRFRPIAPKPAAGGSVSPPATGADVFTKRGRRRYNRDAGAGKKVNNKCNKRKRTAATSSSSDQERSGLTAEDSESTKVTLPLLPETPVSGKHGDVMRVASAADLCFLNEGAAKKAPPAVWLSFGAAARRTVESWVTVESVTAAGAEGKWLGSTDQERRMSLETDTCPGFVSDGVGRVTLTNKPYRKMVGQRYEERDDEVDMKVWVVMKEKEKEKAGVIIRQSPAFTCRVRMQYTCRNEMRSMKVPCDVWRMDGGGFAWRVDVEAALSLTLSLFR